MSDDSAIVKRGKAEASSGTSESISPADAAASGDSATSSSTMTKSVALTRTPSERLAAKLQRDATRSYSSDAAKGDDKVKRDAKKIEGGAAVETVPIEEPAMGVPRKAEPSEDPSGAREAEEARAAANSAAAAATAAASASAQTPPGAVPVAGMGATEHSDAPGQISSPSHVREPYDPTCRESPQWPEIVEVKATLVPDNDEESPSAPVTVSAVATEASDFFIDTKSTRVRCLGLLACLVVVGAVAGGAYAATRSSSPSPSPDGTTPVQVAAGPTTSPGPSPTPSPTVLDWNIVGPEVFGRNTNDRFGWSVSLSSGKRSRFAASAPSNPKILKYLEDIGAPTGSIGLVFVCTEDGDEGAVGWSCEQLSPPSGDRDVLGTIVSISDDGNVLAVGYSRTSRESNGFVQVYRFDETDSAWVEHGTEIVGGDTEARFGGTFQWFDDDGVVYDYDEDVVAQPVTSLSLSGDGDTVAIGSPKDTSGGLPNVKIFRYNKASMVWDQLGDTLSGINEDDFFGQSVSLSSATNAGTHVAIGAPRLWDGPNPNPSQYDASGIVAVYKYEEMGDVWKKIGQNLEGMSVENNPQDARYAYFGDSVSLATAGGSSLIVASAAPYRSRYGSNDNCEGMVKVHRYSEKNDEWEQYGRLLWQNGQFEDVNSTCDEIPPTYENDSGFIVSLSGDGSRLAVGIVGSTPGRLDKGEVRIFDYGFEDDSWNQVGSTLEGRDDDIMEAWSVSLSSSGQRLAVGAPLSKDDAGNEKGNVRVFDFSGASDIVEERQQVLCQNHEMRLELILMTDVHGEQTRWRILDRNNSIPLRGGPYLNGFLETYHIEKCLQKDCYLFSIYDDDYWDYPGLSERGGYNITVDEKESVSGGKFEKREDTFVGYCDGINTTEAFPTYCEDSLSGYTKWEFGDGKCDSRFNNALCGFDRGDCTAFNREYPNCTAANPEDVGDGVCDSRLNIVPCGWDGGDCDLYNSLPNCSATSPQSIGDIKCHLQYNTAGCLWDAGDCDLYNSLPNCLADSPQDLGDGQCDGKYNSEGCNFDAGDCIGFNRLYPGCKVSCVSCIGNGRCQGREYNTEECGWDGGDCDVFNNYPNCTVQRPDRIGDGECHGGAYNTEVCGWDAGDCVEFNKKYPGCSVANPVYVGNGYCNTFGGYNSEACLWDGGDCLNKPTQEPTSEVP